MAIWFHPITLEKLNDWSRGNLGEHLAIEFTDIGDDYLKASMPVDHRTIQPAGVLHGGASAALAEHIGSVAANLCVDPSRSWCVGQEINANHLRPVRSGFVSGVATPLHLGRRSQVWDIRISDGGRKLVCVCRLTMAVLDRETMGNQGSHSKE